MKKILIFIITMILACGSVVSVYAEEWDEVNSYYEGFAIVEKDGKYGFIDESGKVIVYPIYDYLSSFNEGLSIAQQGEKYGFIDIEGNIAIPFIYEYAEFYGFSDGLAIVKDEDSWCFIDKSGNVVTRSPYQIEYHFNKYGLAQVVNREDNGIINLEEEHGYIDKTGNLIIPFGVYGWFDEEGMITAKKDGKYGAYVFLNGKAEIAVPFEYEEIGFAFDEGFVPAKKGNKWGIIDKNNNVIVSFEYDECKPFNEGMAGVCKDGKWGFADTTGKIVIACQFYEIEGFMEDLCAVYTDSRYQLVTNEYGTYPDYEKPNKNCKMGFIDKTGKLVIQYSDYLLAQFAKGWNEHRGFINGYAIVVKNDSVFTAQMDVEYIIMDKSGRIARLPDGTSLFGLDNDFISKLTFSYPDAVTSNEPDDPVKLVENAIITVEDITIKRGERFNPFTNIKAFDDGGTGRDLTKSLIAKISAGSKPLNTNREGEYRITYSVKGNNGNIVSKERIINVIK